MVNRRTADWEDAKGGHRPDIRAKPRTNSDNGGDAPASPRIVPWPGSGCAASAAVIPWDERRTQSNNQKPAPRSGAQSFEPMSSV